MNKLYKQPFRVLKPGLLVMLFFAAFFPSIGQNVVYSESFTNGTSYCPGQSQYNNWGNMRAALDTTTKKFKSVTVKGSLNTSGIVCNDPTITQQIAHALRTNTFFSTTCNGNAWVVAPGCFGGCGLSADAVELIVTTTGSCACASPSYIFRPIIGNLNWGGINGVTCSAPNQLMEVIFSNPVGNNAAAGGLNAPITSCGSNNDSITVIVSNQGQNKIGSVPVTCKVTGTIGGTPYNNTFNTTVGVGLDSILPYTSRNVTFATGLNTTNGADLDFVIYTALSSDTTKGDDTAKVKYKNVGTATGTPTASNVTRCGTGPASLTATVPAGHVGYWYNSTNQLVKVGNSVNSPPVPGGTTATFFVAAAKSSAATRLAGPFNGTYHPGNGFKSGVMFDLIAAKNITVDSIDIHMAGTGVRQVSVYRKSGTYVGSQTAMGAWTLVGRYSVTKRGQGNATTIPIQSFELTPGTHGLYIYADDDIRWENNATLDVADMDLRIFGGQAIRDTFAFPIVGNAKWNGAIHYRQSCVSGTRVPVTVTANPLAVGAVMQQGPVYKGKFDAGTANQPDAVANPDTISYTLLPPTGYTNSNYGTSGSTTWQISSFFVTTVNGTALPASSYSKTNPGSNNGVLYFHPVTGYADSTVKLTVVLRRNDNGCDTVLERYIYLAPRPTADFTYTSVCFGDQTDFTNASTIASGTLDHQWYFGDNTTSNFTDPSKFYATAGNYSVKLVVTSNWNLKDSITKIVDVKQIPQANFEIENACAGTAVKMTDRSSLPTGIPSYTWSYGDNTANGTGATSSHLYSTPGIYLITMGVTVSGCSNSISKYATQAPRATPRFSVSSQVCDNLNVNFKDSSSLPLFGTMGYLYNFGDNTSSTQPNVNHTYNQFRTFTAKLYVRTDLGCLDSATRTITLKESPKPAFTSAGAPCTNSDVTFTDNSTVPTGTTNAYTWEFGDLKTSTATSPIHRYDAPGTYNLTLTIQSTNGCQGSTTGTYVVTEKPAADFTVNKVCQGAVTEFTNGSIISTGNLTYNWDFANSTTSTQTNPTLTYSAPNTYAVRLIATSAAGCTDTVIKNTVVAANPSAAFNGVSGGFGNGTIIFAGPSGAGLNYNWTFGDGGSSTTQNPSYQYLTPGLYTVKLVVTNADGCRGTTTSQFFVNPVGVEEANKSGVKVYPNPTTGKVFADFSSYTGGTITAITITDVLGRMVNNNVSLVNGVADIDLTGQTTGMYFINVITENDNIVYKIMLTKN